MLFHHHYEVWGERVRREGQVQMRTNTLLPAFQRQYQGKQEQQAVSGWTRMARCREGLESLDGQGWKRSFHQKQFHDSFLKACASVFFKNEPAGTFAKAHSALLEFNGWQSLPQEMLISTPRRFSKMVSVSMFAAAILYSAPNVELSIYSTCLRISHKLLRSVSPTLSPNPP